MNSLANFCSHLPPAKEPSSRIVKMAQKVKLYKTLWGVPEVAQPVLWGSMFKQFRQDGFNGIELCGAGPFYPFAGKDDELQRHLRENDLGLIVQLHTLDYPVPSANWQKHVDSLRSKVETVVGLKPEIVNCHSGKDSFRLEDSVRFFEEAVKIEKEFGVVMTHETHRQRIIHSPFVLRDLAPHLPSELKLNADLSHFVCVCERSLSDELDKDFWPEVLDIVAQRCHLIHARVGFSQGPQVNDPFAPEHADDVVAHMGWWKKIAQSMKQRGVVPRVEPEFGPYPYQPHLPYTMQPTADLGEINRKFGAKVRNELDAELA